MCWNVVEHQTIKQTNKQTNKLTTVETGELRQLRDVLLHYAVTYDACVSCQCYKAMNACVNICSACRRFDLCNVQRRENLVVDGRLQDRRSSRLSRLCNAIAGQTASLRLSPCVVADSGCVTWCLWYSASSASLELQRHKSVQWRDAMTGGKWKYNVVFHAAETES